MTTWFNPKTVIAPLDTFATLPDWLAAGMDGERVQASLQRQVPELAEGRPQLVSVWPQRLRAKGEEWLARYQLTVADPGAEPRHVVVVGNLYAPSADLPTGTGDANGSGVAFGEPGWTCWLDDLRLELAVETEDPALPALSDIVDPVAARELIQQVVVKAGYHDASVTAARPYSNHRHTVRCSASDQSLDPGCDLSRCYPASRLGIGMPDARPKRRSSVTSVAPVYSESAT